MKQIWNYCLGLGRDKWNESMKVEKSNSMNANVVTKKRDAATLIVRQWGKENVGERWCEK